jgi:outer membrane receptor protein involved in Fe transport
MFLMLALVCAGYLAAQVTTADVVGRVTDATGAVVPNAIVKLTNQDTNVAREITANESGDFVFNLLPPGRYSLRVEKAGFKVHNVQDIALAAGDRTRADAQMAVGTASESVQVTAEGAALQTDSSSLGTSVSGKLVQDLPLNGRNYIQLAQLAPGVTAGPANGLATGTRPDDRRLNSSFSVNSQDPVANNNMIDGMDNNERLIGTIGVRPSIDAIQEFKVQTNLYTAEVTRTSAGVINILTKSGTNGFHGSAFEFLRNDKLDANGNFNFTGGTQLAKQKFRQNQFGGSLGGPIKKDKTFFFTDYEGLKIRQGIPITAQVPTAKQRIGDFSEGCTAGFNPSGICANAAQQISVANSIGGVPTGSVPFNRLDQAPYRTLLDPFAMKIAALYPLPNGPGVNTINYASSPIRPQDAKTFDGRVDHGFSSSTTLFARYSYNGVNTVQPTGFPAVNGINPGGLFAFAGPNDTSAHGAQLNLVHVFRPNLLLELKAGYLRASIQSKTVNDGKNTANDFGFPCNAVSCVNVGDTQTYGFPRMIMNSGFQELGDAVFVPLLQYDNTFQYNGAVTWTHGTHNLKFGASLIRRQYALIQSASGRGAFTFNVSSTSAPVPLNNGFGNFLLGVPSTIARATSLYLPGYQGWETGTYVQDDWRVNRRLTLNLGVRYDIFTTKTEKHNRLANFDPVSSVILVAGQNSSATTNIGTDHHDFAPRLGFAATLGKGMVLRGGFGLSFFPMDYTSGVALKNPPFTGTLSCGPSTTGSLTNTGCPAGIGLLSQGIPVPLQVSNFPTTSNGNLDLTRIVTSSISAVALDNASSLNMQFNVVLEKQFGNNVVTAGYVGMRGRDLMMAVPDINRALPTGTATPNPRPFAASAPRITGISYYTTQGESSFNSLQLTFNRRLAKGFSVTSGFTYQSSMDDITGLGTSTGGYGNLAGPLSQVVSNIRAYDWATSDFNIKNRWSFGGNYELPFAKSMRGIGGQALAGWQLNGSVVWQTGLPFTVTDATAVSGVIGLTTERPNLVSDNIRAATPTVGSNGLFLNPAAFALPATSASGNTKLGTAPRNIGYGPNQSVMSMSVFKTFRVTERMGLQFRTEIFNLPNHPVFGNPNVTFGNANFGTVTQTAGIYAPRQIQFALKLLF